MVAECTECQGRAGLDDKRCLTGILNGLTREYNVDSVILSHYIETKYTDDAMHMLEMMVKMANEMDQMAIREPYREYFENDDGLTSSLKNQQKSTCGKCALRPETIFSKLKKHLLSDIDHFYTEFGSITGQVDANGEEACAQCMKAMQSDLIYLFNKLEGLRAFIIYKGFQIVM